MEATSEVIGIVSEDIPIASYGFITTGGIINNLDTFNNEYSGFTAGDILYLSDTIAGQLTNVIPAQPSFSVKVGRLITKDATLGTIHVDAYRLPLIRNLGDTYISSGVTTDDILKWNGYYWTNGPATLASASAGINFYLDNTSIISGGTTQNTNGIKSFIKIPLASTEVAEVITIPENTTVMGKTYLYDTALGRTQLDGGVWDFNIYMGKDIDKETVNLIERINKVSIPTGNTITMTGTGAARTVTASAGTPFISGTTIDFGGTIITDSYLQTPSGFYRITGRISDTVISIETPTTYTNESAVGYSIHKHLFDVTSANIDNVAGTSPAYTGLILYTMKSVQPLYLLDVTDRISVTMIGSANKDIDIVL